MTIKPPFGDFCSFFQPSNKQIWEKATSFWVDPKKKSQEMLCTCDARSFTAQLGRIQVEERIFWEGIQAPRNATVFPEGFWPMKNPSYCTY